ncbi:D-alanine--(R)-lactate ligase [Kribbella sp. NPDC048915]|uniref:D-alanine--(R)-lactate ligase n=1 Tax=Kribbella sp. NPDC048915 TaxID=3155148 RepID=UPI0033DD0573
MDKVKLGILFGGESEEHGVSVKSAQEIARNLDLAKYDPYFIGITRHGAWKLCAGPAADWETSASTPVVLSPDRSVQGLLLLESDRLGSRIRHGQYRTVNLDVVLPVLHGKRGEDGVIQGLLELSGIPYVGCGVQASVQCMDKSLTYTVARQAGIATPNFWLVTGELDPAELPYPVFVKPARSGSSFGVGKVTRAAGLAAAIETASRYDGKVLIEEAVAGSEIGCAVMGNELDLMTGELDHIALTHGFFKIHQEDSPETGSENSTPIVPADIPESARVLVQETAQAVYAALGCSGLARVDMFLTPDGQAVLNEVNTFPGMTSYSRYPRMMAAAGVPLAEVIDRLVTLTLTGKLR